jgi:hypothetical protein
MPCPFKLSLLFLQQRLHQQQQQLSPSAASEPRLEPHQQPEPVAAAAAKAQRTQQRLRPQTGHLTPQARSRRKANLSGLSRPASADAAPFAAPPAATSDWDGVPAAAAPVAAVNGAPDAEAVAKALRRHTLLREKNRRAQANARRRKKVLGCMLWRIN